MAVNGVQTSSELFAHPAVVAWRRLWPELVPHSVEELIERPSSAIYALAGLGPRGSAVIAKRSRAPKATIERTIYEEVLPDLPVSVPRFYGMTGSGDGFGWLFTEDVGEEAFSPASATQRTLAAQWLGRLHSAAARLDAAARLPDRGPAHYLDHLRHGRETICRSLDNPALSAEDQRVLKAVSAQCDALERAWGGIERFCAGVPRTLVHGDFRSKNVRLRAIGADTTLCAFDWEMAGWGVPAPDLAVSPGFAVRHLAVSPGEAPAEQVDLATYASIAHDYWPRVDAAALQELVIVGAVFRRLAAIGWESLSLSRESPQWVVANMRVYWEELRILSPDLPGRPSVG
jgi:aminoglycoside phosphotransferase (APT) family kinase protein